MRSKYFLYIFVIMLTIWSMDSININAIFKKNRRYQALTFYLLLILGIAYLVTNFIIDVTTSFGI